MTRAGSADTLNVLSLFAGIGGLELGLERAGMTVVGQVERSAFCRAALAKHWPDVPRHDEVRTCARWWRSRPRPAVDLVAGGFPCQPFSHSVTGRRGGRRLGVADERWGWPWMRDAIADLRPRWVLVENVPGLLSDGDAFGWILSDLAELGFDAEWGVVSACAVGAPHVRRRLFLVAYTDSLGLPPSVASGSATQQPGPRDRGWWSTEPGVGRVADGLAGWVDRIRALGNAAVPQVAEHIGRLIVTADRERVAA